MKISINWLKEYIDLKEYSTEQIGEMLTKSGLEVEGIDRFETVRGGLEGLLIGEVVSCEKHPNADKLSITKVDLGNGQLVPIVCGAPNVAKGQKVVVAPVNTTIYPIDHDPINIKKTKIRGEVSEGMIVAEDEVGLGTSHEGIMVLDTSLPSGTPATDYFDIQNDEVLEIGLTPNRADAASHIGVARDLKALLNRDINLPEVSDFQPDNQNLTIPVVLENKKACPRYTGVTISNIKIADSPTWIQNRIKAIGLTPINNVVDITNFVLHELGQPLHAFDADKIQGQKVVVKTLPKGTKFKTLDEKERTLLSEDLMICDEKEGMCIAGVFGGIDSGVTEYTKNIFLESAYFAPDFIRKTSQHHGLKTDASFRFERGTDPDMTVIALKRAALMIKELAGGEISSEIVDEYPDKILPLEVEIKFAHIDRLIGKKIEKKKIKEILNNLDIQIVSETNQQLKVLVPPYRVDVTREADVIEEILRIYGYDNIEYSPQLNTSYIADFPLRDQDALQNETTALLAANGFNEIITNSLTRPQFSENLISFETDLDVKIINKLSEDLSVMRQSLLFTGLDVIAYNINHRQTDLKLFEFGREYTLKADKYLEKDKLAIFLTGLAESESWRNSSRSVDFHDLSAIVNKVLRKFSPAIPQQSPSNDNIFEYGLEAYIGGKTVVKMGKLHAKAIKLAEIKQAIFFAEFDWSKLLESTEMEFKYEEVSKFPEVRRDLSLVIDKNITFEAIKNIALKQENRLIRNINIFDYYEGENIGKNKKAYALSFTLQDFNKTLTDKVIDKVMQKLIKSFEDQLGALIRK